MKIRIPVIVKDPEVSSDERIAPTEMISVEEGAFLDGPMSPRVAVLDFEPGRGSLAPAATFLAPPDSDGIGDYQIPSPVLQGAQSVDRVAAAVSVFGAVYKTIRMFEEPDALGRTVTWAFSSPQLFVVPRAGEWANAFYERESQSLQFFFFDSPVTGRRIHTAHSQDIVAHETAHALVDGIAPDLYGAVTPQSLAIHEAVADLAALLVSLRSRELASRVLKDTGGDIRRSSVFSGLGEQFGGALNATRQSLRDLQNDKSLSDVSRSEPHDLSEVLSGAFYEVFLRTYEALHAEYEAEREPDPSLIAAPEAAFVEQAAQQVADVVARSPGSSHSRALFVAGERLKRLLLRGLDYMPPGDVTYVDLARAVLAADQASHPESSLQREWLKKEFVRRGIAPSAVALRVKTDFSLPSVAKLDVEQLIASDYYAYGFAERHRPALGIPAATPFEVRPRVDVSKLYWHRDGNRVAREVLFKVSWSAVEANAPVGGLPRRRRFRAGTTLAIGLDRSRPYVRAILSSSRSPKVRRDTDALLRTLVDEDRLVFGGFPGWHDLPPRDRCEADVASDVLRIQGLARTLHVTREVRS